MNDWYEALFDTPMPVTPTLLVLSGLPACGKSHWRELHCSRQDWHHATTDDYIELVAQSQGKTYNDVFADCIQDATREMNLQVADAYRAGRNVVWDQTNLGVKKRGRILRGAPHYYNRMGLHFVLDEEARQVRLSLRKGKFISPKVDRDMRQRASTPTLEDGFDNVAFIDGAAN